MHIQKHKLDRATLPRDSAPGWMFAIKLSAMPSKASVALQRRPRMRTQAPRVMHFLRLAHQ
ncbi:hypothetical protein [Yoonia sp.]|uniref:hypothetical protein n=1 Tax=Yoonia sp. TaxID=2212373 RepID=UPI0019E4892D|nr:hypothetical protein [Yoonia sp.]MBE0412744.1 hypothetical protein [Yoonia sp.]